MRGSGGRWARLVAIGAMVMVASLPAGARAADPTHPTILFGAYAGRGSDRQAAVLDLEARLGRSLAGVRAYDLWDDVFPSAYDTWLRDTGHVEFLSVRARRINGQDISWRSIANAQPGSALYDDIVRWATSVKAYGAPLYFTFHHEPEAAASDANGTNVDYVDAWRKVISVFRDQGVMNATYLWIMTSYAFRVGDDRNAERWYPGDDYVDAVGEDSYNWYNCRPGVNNPWRSLEYIVDPLREWGLEHPTKPLMLTEFASHEDPAVAGRKATWVDEARELFKRPGWEQFTAVLYYDRTQKPTCNFWIDSSTGSAASVAALGADPFYGLIGGAEPDMEPPSVPGQPTGQSSAPGSIDLTWPASDDDIATSLSYRVYRDGGSTAIGTVSSASSTTVSFTDSGLLGGTIHTYEVTASDGPNTSARSVASAPITVQATSEIFADDFAEGFSRWSTAVGMTLDDAAGAPSPPSALVQAAASRSWASASLGGSFASVCASARINLDSTTDGGSLFRLRTASDGPVVRIFASPARVLSIRSDVSGVQASTGIVLPLDTWTSLELCGTIGTAGAWTLYREGVPVFGPWMANTGTTPIGRITIGTPDVRTISFRLDDVRVDQVPG